MLNTRAAAIVLASSFVVLNACTPPAPKRAVSMGGEPVNATSLTADEVARAVVVTERERDVVYRAPRLSATRQTDLRNAGPTFGANLGQVALGQSGFLFGVRDRQTGSVKHLAAFQSDFVEGHDRFKSVTLADGSHPSFRIAPSDPKRCKPDCYLTFETMLIELPDAALRGVPDTGLALSITLDKGTNLPVTVPAAYVHGYLQALDAKR